MGTELCEALDRELETFCQLHDELVEKYAALSATMRDGYFQLAKARYSLGSTLAPLSFDMGTKATLFVAVEQPTEAEEFPRLTAQHGVFLEDAAATDSAKPRRRSPLHWYGGLPPPALRQSAQHFSAATERAIELAAIRCRMMHAAERYQRLLAQKRALV